MGIVNHCSEPDGEKVAYVRSISMSMGIDEKGRSRGYKTIEVDVTQHAVMISETGQCPWCGATNLSDKLHDALDDRR
jgi:hypothetical protein